MIQKRYVAKARPTREMEIQFPCLLAIDPSVNNLGWAIYDFSMGGDMYDITGPGWRYGLIHPKGANLQYKWKDSYFKLKDLIGRNRYITHMAAEWPMYFSGLRGKLAAEQNYTINLAGLTGYLVGKLGVKAEFASLWTPTQWKGSVPKHITAAKFVRLFGPAARHIATTQSNDVVDAIMIAEFWLSLYSRQKFHWQKTHEHNTMDKIA